MKDTLPDLIRPPLVFTLFAGLTLPVCTSAQTFSYDGNRWYEIEVSIFANESASTSDELLIPDSSDLVFPESLRVLVPATSTYQVDFDETDPQAELTEMPAALLQPLAQMAETGESEVEPEPVIGPVFFSGESSFQLTDFERTPFIALGDEAAHFLDYNEDLQNSPDHRLLFHAVWRQPVMNRIQSTPILVTGGDSFEGHFELEGSLRFSYNINRVDVEANLWIIEFAETADRNSVFWRLPPLPEMDDVDDNSSEDIADNGAVPVSDISFMNEVRSMISNELHYLDHPDIGMLVQIRPYQLPETMDFSF